MLLKKKYIERKPNMANILELKTINGLVVMAKIAGILSKAKRISVNSTKISTKNRGVATRRCFFFTKKNSFSTVDEMGMIFLTVLKIKDFLGLYSLLSFENSNLRAVSKRNTPKSKFPKNLGFITSNKQLCQNSQPFQPY